MKIKYIHNIIIPQTETFSLISLVGSNISNRKICHWIRLELYNDIHPHTFRHTFATDIYRETKNIRLVQKALGHSDLSTTMIYTHIVDDEMGESLKDVLRKR